MALGLVACGGGQEPSERTLATGSQPSSLTSPTPRAPSNEAQGSVASVSQDNASRSTDLAETAKRGEPDPVVPTNLWQPPAGATPASGSYVYLHSEPTDEVGQGLTRLYTPANAVLSARYGRRSGGFGWAPFLGISVKGDQQWEGDFQVSTLLSQVQTGHYVRLKQYPRHDPVFGGLSWSSEGRSCKLSNGWVAVDNIVLSGSQVVQVEFRFEQVCHDSQGRLRGKVRWAATDNPPVSQPVNPIPATLWTPPDGAMPASGNALYIESDPLDFIAEGKTVLYTAENTSLFYAGVSASSRVDLLIWVHGLDNGLWLGRFLPMTGLTRLEPGIYSNLPDRINHFDPMYGGFDLGGFGTNCHTSHSWVAIDRVSFDSDRLTGIDMRFEQFCWNEGEGLRGAFRWTAPTVN